MDCRHFLSRRRPRIEVPGSATLDRQSGQHSRAIGARIDPDAIDLLVDLGADRVPMDDNEAVVRVIEKERFANPAQIGLALLFDLNAGTDSGMDEEKIAETAGVSEFSEEFLMLFRNCLANDVDGLALVTACKLLGINTVAFKAFLATEPPPLRYQLGLSFEDSEQDLLVVAEQE